MRTTFILAALLLAGCASQTVWIKHGATQDDFNREAYECERDSRQSGYYGGGLIGVMNMQEFYSRCMRAHGYTIRSN